MLIGKEKIVASLNLCYNKFGIKPIKKSSNRLSMMATKMTRKEEKAHELSGSIGKRPYQYREVL